MKGKRERKKIPNFSFDIPRPFSRYCVVGIYIKWWWKYILFFFILIIFLSFFLKKKKWLRLLVGTISFVCVTGVGLQIYYVLFLPLKCVCVYVYTVSSRSWSRVKGVSSYSKIRKRSPDTHKEKGASYHILFRFVPSVFFFIFIFKLLRGRNSEKIKIKTKKPGKGQSVDVYLKKKKKGFW